MKINNYKIGSDVEFFIKDGDSIRSAEGLIRGTKHNPFKFNPENKHFATSLDCVLAEGNIPPVEDKMSWLRNMNILRNYINSQLPVGMSTVALPAVYMDEQWLRSPTASVFGCEPAFIVYERCQKDAPDPNTNLRSAGLHVHISYDNAEVEVTEQLIKAMDLFLSVPATVTEDESDRKKLYGQAGEFRFGQSYQGGEYRSLSAWWAENERRLGWVYDNTINAIRFVNENYSIDEAAEELIQVAVNQSNKEVAQQLIDKYNIPVLA